MIVLIIRVVLGSLALAVVWLAAWPFDSGSYLPLLAAGVSGVLLSAVASRASVALKQMRRRYALAFAIPFAAPPAISALALSEGAVRPFLFWAFVGLSAVGVALTTDLLIFRIFQPHEK